MAAYRRTHSPSLLAWSEGWRPLDAQSVFIEWTRWTLTMVLPWWQHYKHWHCYYLHQKSQERRPGWYNITTRAYLANSEIQSTEIKQVHSRNGIVNGLRRLILNVAKTSTHNWHTPRVTYSYTLIATRVFIHRANDSTEACLLLLVLRDSHSGYTRKDSFYRRPTLCLYSRDFGIFLPNIIKIDHYNSELYAVSKLVHFFETQCRENSTRTSNWLIEHGLTSAPTQYRLYGRRARTSEQDISLVGLASSAHNMATGKFGEDLFLFGQVWY